MNRRKFIGKSMAASAAVITSASVRGANDRIVVANIGCGRRDLLGELIELRETGGIEIHTVCDTWRQKRERAAQRVADSTGSTPQQAVRYQEVLEREDIDAVLIGTPDHQHCTMLIDAIKAGKHVYVEKPLAMNMAELNRAYDVVKSSNQIVQLGTQMRSYPTSNGAREFIQASKLGKILKVEQARNGYMPYWMSYGGPEFFAEKPTPSDVDWEGFQMNAAPRPFDPSRYQNWYGYREYSKGPHTNLAVHFIDLVHYVNDLEPPEKVVAFGGTYRWKNEFTVPDSVEMILHYKEDLLVRYTTVFGNGANTFAKWFGTLGTIDAQRLSSETPWIASGDGSGEPDKLGEMIELPKASMPHHMQNWFDSIRSGRQPVAPIEAGYRHSVAVLMAEEAMRTGNRMTFDPLKREIKAG
ncbi:MAG: Gfo/Idh/MocA family oxidoreductase [Acidobacteriota bacterium]|nr:MAG: Gfo/Idh/MocA family oxidoreductase [Acidobacteriota bacterium]